MGKARAATFVTRGSARTVNGANECCCAGADSVLQSLKPLRSCWSGVAAEASTCNHSRVLTEAPKPRAAKTGKSRSVLFLARHNSRNLL
jgi:hypothetical protein